MNNETNEMLFETPDDISDGPISDGPIGQYPITIGTWTGVIPDAVRSPPTDGWRRDPRCVVVAPTILMINSDD